MGDSRAAHAFGGSREASWEGREARPTDVRPVPVQGDAEFLRRAIENVIRNAIRQAPEVSAVEASLTAAGGRATVRIRDYGQGVLEEALPRTFAAFYQAETNHDGPAAERGWGCRCTAGVELHKGAMIRARNAGLGLLMEIDLPAAEC